MRGESDDYVTKESLEKMVRGAMQLARKVTSDWDPFEATGRIASVLINQTLARNDIPLFKALEAHAEDVKVS